MIAIKRIREDLYRYCGSKNWISFLKALRYPGFVYTIFFRLTQCVSKFNPIWYLSRFFLWFFSYRFGFQIPASTNIGSGFFVAHFGTIIVNGKCTIGANCNLSPNVVIGQTNRGYNMGVPMIGDFVWIGTGSVVVGKIYIGNNVLIAPNTFVNFDVPDNSIVIGNPAKIIYSPSATNGYLNNLI
jgi:serine O-acetyltransferase